MNYKSLDDPTNNHTFVYTMSGFTTIHHNLTYAQWRSREGGLIELTKYRCLYCDKRLDLAKWVINDPTFPSKRKMCKNKDIKRPVCPNMVETWQSKLNPNHPWCNSTHSTDCTVCASLNIRCAKEDEALAKCQQDINDCDGVQMDY